VQARGAAEPVTRSDGERVTLVKSPLRLSETPPEPLLAPPLLGADTESVLKESLGARAEDIAQWRANGVVG
jgi:formyl-CoA transferase